MLDLHLYVDYLLTVNVFLLTAWRFNVHSNINLKTNEQYIETEYPFVLFLLVIVLSVLLRYTDSDYPFGIFKLFLQTANKLLCMQMPLE
jgi:hypothetical protein